METKKEKIENWEKELDRIEKKYTQRIYDIFDNLEKGDYSSETAQVEILLTKNDLLIEARKLLKSEKEKLLESLRLGDKAYCHLPECQRQDNNDLPCDCGIQQRNDLYDIFREEQDKRINKKIENLKEAIKKEV